MSSIPKGTNEQNGPATMPFVGRVDLPTEPPVKVLVVQNEESQTRLLRRILSEAGEARFHLVVATRLEDAAKRVEGGQFDAVLLDTDLPDSDGLEAVYRMQKYARELPIVVLGTLDAPEVAIESVRLGAQDYLLKHELDGRTLIRSLRLGIERNRMHQIHALTRLLENLEDMPGDTERRAAGV